MRRSILPALLGLALGVAPVHASDTDVKRLERVIQEMQRRIDALSAGNADLRRKVERLESARPALPAAPTAEAPPAVTSAPTPAEEPPAPSLYEATPKSLVKDHGISTPHQEAAARPGGEAIDPALKGFLPIPDTRSYLRFGGYARLDGIVDNRKVGDPDEFVPATIPVGGQPDRNKDGERFNLHAKQSRLTLEYRRPATFGGDLRIYYENDFFGSSSKDFEYHLRHFYGQTDHFVVGQTSTTFTDDDALPDTIDYEGPNGSAYLRQVQGRAFWPLRKTPASQMYLAFAAEKPVSDIDQKLGTGRTFFPDFVGRWRYEEPTYHVQAAGLVRRVGVEADTTGAAQSALGFGLNLTTSVNLPWAGDRLSGQIALGRGIGRYFEDANGRGTDAALDASGDLVALDAFGTYVGYTHEWADHWRSTATYSRLHVENEASQDPFAFHQTQYASVNLKWAPSDVFWAGIEYLWGENETKNGASGDASRVQLAVQYGFLR